MKDIDGHDCHLSPYDSCPACESLYEPPNLMELFHERNIRLDNFAKLEGFYQQHLDRLWGEYGVGVKQPDLYLDVEVSLVKAKEYNRETDELLLGKYLLF